MFDDLTKALADIHINHCKADVSREGSYNGTGWNKLRTYRLFKKHVKKWNDSIRKPFSDYAHYTYELFL